MPKIDQMYAFIAEDTSPDDEGVVALQSKSQTGETVWLPMVGADMARVDSLRHIAEGIGKQTGCRVTLVRFTQREDLEVVHRGG